MQESQLIGSATSAGRGRCRRQRLVLALGTAAVLLLAFAQTAFALDTPVLTGTDQASPANDNNPKVKGTISADTTTVKIYTDATCTEPFAVSGSAADFTGAGIVVPVADNTTTTFSARAVDDVNQLESGCSNSIDYVEDSTAPDAPTLTATDPSSPANENNPKVIGTVGADPPASVLIYTDAACTEPAVASGSVTDFTGLGIAVTVPDDSTTSFAARAVDVAGNKSACSNAISYVEDSPPPVVSTPPTVPAVPASPVGSQSTIAARPAASFVLIAGRAIKVNRNRAVTVRLNCSGTKECSGRVVLTTASGIRLHRHRLVLRLGSSRFSMAPATTAKVKIRLSKSKYRLLKRLGRAKALVTVTDVDRAGRARISTREITLRA
jgi:hypothetical protein